MKRLLFLVGTRPEVIKIAPVWRAAKGRGDFLSRLCSSGQHKELLRDALAEEGITPDLSFTVEGSLAEKSSECLLRFDAVLAKERPDAVAVHGDTLTAFMGALAAFYRGIPVLHIEAGLRTGSPFSPFPEELYRRTIDTLSTLCFAPTPRAATHLYKEGKPQNTVLTVGNTVIDGLFEEIDPAFSHPLLAKGRLLLLTLHRRETQGEIAARICRGIRRALDGRQGIVLLSPVHPSPAVGRVIRGILGDAPAVTLTPPLGKREFRNLLARAELALTDSGGVSEEATALGTPTLLLREESERGEGVEAGVLHPVGTREEEVYLSLSDFLERPRPRRPSNVFGDGGASVRIVSAIQKFFSEHSQGDRF